MNNANEQKTYVCKRARMCSFLIEKGFTPYKVAPDWEYVCTARFSNGEAWYQLASNPRARLKSVVA